MGRLKYVRVCVEIVDLTVLPKFGYRTENGTEPFLHFCAKIGCGGTAANNSRNVTFNFSSKL